MYKSHLFTILLLVLLGCSQEKSNTSGWNFDDPKPGFEPISTDSLNLEMEPILFSDSSTHFRGLYRLGDSYFISGTEGKILINSEQLSQVELFEAKYTDLRDIHVLRDSSILVMGIASPGHIWKISKGENTWRKVYSNMDTLVFMDGMDFWNDSIGLVYGDPIDGYHFILKTVDGGESWDRIPSISLPEPLEEEAGFAASGTGVQCIGNGVAYIGLGGPVARILKTEDYGSSWDIIKTPLMSGKGGKGIYSLAFKDEYNGIIVGGYWKDPECDSSKAYTFDGGKSWTLSHGLQHYRSCATYIGKNTYLSTGTSGTDISYDNGQTWVLLDSVGFNSIIVKDSVGMAIGSYGKVCNIKLK